MSYSMSKFKNNIQKAFQKQQNQGGWGAVFRESSFPLSTWAYALVHLVSKIFPLSSALLVDVQFAYNIKFCL